MHICGASGGHNFFQGGGGGFGPTGPPWIRPYSVINCKAVQHCLCDIDIAHTLYCFFSRDHIIRTIRCSRHHGVDGEIIELIGPHLDGSLTVVDKCCNHRFHRRQSDYMHMASIRVRYGFRWHSVKPYRTSHRPFRYDLSECHLNSYRTRIDVIYIFSHKIPLSLSSTRN